MKPDDALEGRGLPAERRRLANSRWQFKVHVRSQDDGAGVSEAGRVLQEAWNKIIRCNDSVHTARAVLCVSCTPPFL